MNDTVSKLGEIVSNRKSLECLLRLFLKEADDVPRADLTPRLL